MTPQAASAISDEELVQALDEVELEALNEKPGPNVGDDLEGLEFEITAARCPKDE